MCNCRKKVHEARHSQNHSSVNDTEESNDTSAIIAPEPKATKEPSLSLVKVLAKHYGATLALVCVKNLGYF